MVYKFNLPSHGNVNVSSPIGSRVVETTDIFINRVLRGNVCRYAVAKSIYPKDVISWKPVLGQQLIQYSILPSLLDVASEANADVEDIFPQSHFHSTCFVH